MSFKFYIYGNGFGLVLAAKKGTLKSQQYEILKQYKSFSAFEH